MGYNGNFTLFFIRDWSKVRYEYFAYGNGSNGGLGDKSILESNGLGISFGSYRDNDQFVRASICLTGFLKEKFDSQDIDNLDSFGSPIVGPETFMSTLQARFEIRIGMLYFGTFFTNHYYQRGSSYHINPWRVGMHLGISAPY